MKKDLNINTRHFLASLIIAAGCLISCEKQEIQKRQENTGVATARPVCVNDDRGSGDDEEDPIIEGIVQDKNGQGVANAVMQIFAVSSNIPTDSQVTDANGHFEMKVPAGSYFFEVTSGASVNTTNAVNITQDMNVVITI